MKKLQTIQIKKDAKKKVFWERNVACYERANDALNRMHAYIDEPDHRQDYLTQGMTALEGAVSDIGALVAEEAEASAS